MTEYISQENVKFDTLTSWIESVFPLALAEEKAKWGRQLQEPLVPQHGVLSVLDSVFSHLLLLLERSKKLRGNHERQKYGPQAIKSGG